MSIKTELQDAIDYCNTALVNKGADEASTVYEIGDMIDTIQQGGGGTYETNWNDLATMSFGALSENPYEFTVPANITSLSDWFRNNTSQRNYDIIVHNTGDAITNLYRTFNNSLSLDRTITLDFDTSSVTNWYYFCNGQANAKITINGTLDFTSATNITDMLVGYSYYANIQSSFRIAEGTLGLSFKFNGNITDETLASIVAGLKDMTGQTAPTLTMNSNVKTRLTTEQIAEITAKNWTLA